MRALLVTCRAKGVVLSTLAEKHFPNRADPLLYGLPHQVVRIDAAPQPVFYRQKLGVTIEKQSDKSSQWSLPT